MAKRPGCRKNSRPNWAMRIAGQKLIGAKASPAIAPSKLQQLRNIRGFLLCISDDLNVFSRRETEIFLDSNQFLFRLG